MKYPVQLKGYFRSISLFKNQWDELCFEISYVILCSNVLSSNICINLFSKEEIIFKFHITAWQILSLKWITILKRKTFEQNILYSFVKLAFSKSAGWSVNFPEQQLVGFEPIRYGSHSISIYLSIWVCFTTSYIESDSGKKWIIFFRCKLSWNHLILFLQLFNFQWFML